MLVNSSKFQVMIMTKKKCHINECLHIDGHKIVSKQSVVLLGVVIDDKRKFKEFISELCKRAANQLNSLYRFRSYLNEYTRKMSVYSFAMSNFSYCPLVWHFCSAESNNKLEQIRKRALKFIGTESLCDKLQTPFQIQRLRVLAIEIFKTLNDLNPIYMKSIFNQSGNSVRNCKNLVSQAVEQVTYGKRSLRFLGPILWNSLPKQAKDITDISEFKNFMNHWGIPNCPFYEKFGIYCTSIDYRY